MDDKPPMPKALTYYEAVAQLSHAVWELFAVIFSAVPWLGGYCADRAALSFAYAMEARVRVVGRPRAYRDYFPADQEDR